MTKNYKINRTVRIHEVVKVKAPIVEALQKSVDNPSFQFHIPGHTKGRAIFPDFKKLIGEKALNVDTTDEFDNLGTLHPATGPLAKLKNLLRKLLEQKKLSFYLMVQLQVIWLLACLAQKQVKKLLLTVTAIDQHLQV